ncbi:hypothetical protein [Chryseobacterium sp.]|uniref:hypothetical protein n=1 Tax=Chryseobacterium sp. TaxID=1871047 RepID=UPI002FCACABD
MNLTEKIVAILKFLNEEIVLNRWNNKVFLWLKIPKIAVTFLCLKTKNRAKFQGK